MTNFQAANCHYYFNDLKKYPNKPECDGMWSDIQKARGNLNWYDLFRTEVPKTKLLKDINREGSVIVAGEEKKYTRGFTMQEYTPWAKHLLQDSPHLLGAGLSDYVNSAEVRKALNIPDSVGGWN